MTIRLLPPTSYVAVPTRLDDRPVPHIRSKEMDTQVVELLGRNRLIDELLRAGLEIALPLRDRGVDLIAFADVSMAAFAACPIQMKAWSGRGFSIDAKYARFPNLLLAHIWYVDSPEDEVTFALTYLEGLAVADAMGWTKTASWRKGIYTSTAPDAKLRELLEPHRMNPDSWRQKVAGVSRAD
jgi:hypothetical protein